MSNLNVNAVEEALLELSDEYWGELEYVLTEPQTVQIDGEDYTVELVESWGDGNWEYETGVVVKVGDQLYRKTGTFMSHYGNDWDGPFQEVDAIERPVTVYEAVTRPGIVYEVKEN